jgi:hypothetical protein
MSLSGRRWRIRERTGDFRDWLYGRWDRGCRLHRAIVIFLVICIAFGVPRIGNYSGWKNLIHNAPLAPVPHAKYVPIGSVGVCNDVLGSCLISLHRSCIGLNNIAVSHPGHCRYIAITRAGVTSMWAHLGGGIEASCFGKEKFWIAVSGNEIHIPNNRYLQGSSCAAVADDVREPYRLTSGQIGSKEFFLRIFDHEKVGCSRLSHCKRLFDGGHSCPMSISLGILHLDKRLACDLSVFAGSIGRLFGSLGLPLDFSVGLVHDPHLTPSETSVSGGSQERQASDNRKDHLYGVIFFSVFMCMSVVSFWRLHCGDSPFYFFPVLVGCFFGIAYGVYLFTARLSQSAQLLLQHFHQRFELATKHGLASTFQGG